MLRSPLSSPLRSPLSSPLAARRGGGAAFDPATLFASGEQGGWYDPSDLTTLFQDTAGLTPVTATGQSVGRMLDKSGRGNHLTATGTERPTYQVDGSGNAYLQANGSTNRMYTAAGVDLTGTTRVMLSVAVRVEGTGNQAIFSNNATGTSRFNILYLAGSSPTPRGDVTTSGGPTQITVPSKGAAPYFVVNSSDYDSGAATSNGRLVFRQDGAQPTQTIASAGVAGGAFSSQPFSLFSISAAGVSFPFNGRFYGGIVRGAATDVAIIRQAEDFLGAKAGLFF
jgi:hypothetical protein